MHSSETGERKTSKCTALVETSARLTFCCPCFYMFLSICFGAVRPLGNPAPGPDFVISSACDRLSSSDCIMDIF